MRSELDEVICRTFPNLYRDRNATVGGSNMRFGFPGDGWFLIIWNLSAKLEPLIKVLPAEEIGLYKASQVKEKFGTLRFYMSTSTQEMELFITAAEEASCNTCEECGMPGQLHQGSWMRTLCDTHTPDRITKDNVNV